MRCAALGRTLGVALAAATLLVGAAPAVASAADLVDFGNCGQLVRFVRAGASSDEETYPSWVNGSWDASLYGRSVWSKDRFDDDQYTDGATAGGYADANDIVQDVPAAAESAGKADGGEEVSGTNVQEEGVDEPDVVKADGKYLYVMAGSRLRIYKLRPAVPQLIAQLRLPIAEGRLLRSGDRLLVIGARPERSFDAELEPIAGAAGPDAPAGTTPAPTTPTGTSPTTPAATSSAAARAAATTPATTPSATSPTTPPATTPVGTSPTTPDTTTPLTPAGDPWPVPAKETDDSPYARYPFTTRLMEVSIEDPSAPQLVRTLDAPGTPITARQVGSTVRLVIDASTDPDDEEDDDVTLNELRPFTRLESEITGAVYKRPEAPCFDIARPSDGYSGAELLSILTFDLDRGLVAPQRLGVMATPQTVYASTHTLYVASSVEHERGTTDGYAGDSSTDIFQFDASEPGKTSYLGHGSVPGLPVNSYAFSESAGGDLRVATSTYAWWETDSGDDCGDDTCDDTSSCDTEDCDAVDSSTDQWGEDADTRMTVLRRDGEDLREIGVRAGLDKGEQVSAVRFDGDRAYVASSGEDDPLRVLDLSNPTAPQALGVLRLPGESTYLHPLGDDLLLSVGRDRSKDDQDVYGSRVSLYDVADPAHPRRLAARRLGPGWTPTDYDTHAFLWWPKRKTAFVPYSGYGYWKDDDSDPSAMVALQASRSTKTPNLVEQGRISHGPQWDHPDVVRAVVVGDRLITLSEIGLSSNRLSDLSLLGTAPFFPAG